MTYTEELRPYDWRDEENEDGSNRDVPPFDNDPRTDEQIKQEVYDQMRDELDDDHPQDWEGW